jgi:hypothetical protein
MVLVAAQAREEEHRGHGDRRHDAGDHERGVDADALRDRALA